MWTTTPNPAATPTRSRSKPTRATRRAAPSPRATSRSISSSRAPTSPYERPRAGGRLSWRPPPAVPHRAVGAGREQIESVRPPGGRGRGRHDDPAERFPAFPGVAVPPPVPHRTVGADGEDVDAIGTPADRGRLPDDHAAEGLP